MPFAKRDSQFTPSKVRTEASVHASAECEVPIRLAVELYFQWIGEMGWIEIGGCPTKTDGGSSLYGMTEDLYVFLCPAHAGRDNRLPSQ